MTASFQLPSPETTGGMFPCLPHSIPLRTSTRLLTSLRVTSAPKLSLSSPLTVFIGGVTIDRMIVSAVRPNSALR